MQDWRAQSKGEPATRLLCLGSALPFIRVSLVVLHGAFCFHRSDHLNGIPREQEDRVCGQKAESVAKSARSRHTYHSGEWKSERCFRV